MMRQGGSGERVRGKGREEWQGNLELHSKVVQHITTPLHAWSWKAVCVRALARVLAHGSCVDNSTDGGTCVHV